MNELKKTERRRKAQREAERALQERDKEKVLRAAGAIKIDESAARILRPLAANEIAEYAVRAQEVSEIRQETEINAEGIACAAAQPQRAPSKNKEMFFPFF